VGGLLATRPDVVAHATDGGREHVAEARQRTGDWIAALSPDIAAPLAGWLRSAAEQRPVERASLAVAEVLLDRLR
jgi:hypothetical protein